ncbi:MAG: type II toxin-antitoxin system RelE/ParE family toxin [Sphingobium sp.]|uniref:type II toxin-antitoxin system RelE/ParE family toxin n=1 Tax=Sphingobium sp. TaxID=1912891 RepID=UPI0029A5F864|nr:type II toxin-antitoxin system RelE/ParE family toxin [Sphingobium sp.]MDX3911006.1 type II toxin-antitoxin system RelE/ParE family toxin [Sphingobium sp.]
MTWEVRLHSAFEDEVLTLERDVRVALFAAAKLLSDFGPQLGRPHADTLKGSRHANMKELRFEAADGEWRAAFAFDPERKAILLVAGDKSGGSQKRFYRSLIAKADFRFSDHLESLKSGKKEK